MSKLYLLTQSGERHEDHIPIGVFDFDGLMNKLGEYVKVVDFDEEGSYSPFLLTEESQIDDCDDWFKIVSLDVDCYTFEEDELERWKTGNFIEKDEEGG